MVVALAAMASLFASVDASMPAHLAEFAAAWAAMVEILWELEAISAALDSAVAWSWGRKGKSKVGEDGRRRNVRLVCATARGDEFSVSCDLRGVEGHNLFVVSHNFAVRNCVRIIREGSLQTAELCAKPVNFDEFGIGASLLLGGGLERGGGARRDCVRREDA